MVGRQGRTVLLGWGGADWADLRRMLDAGALPHLAEIAARGFGGPLRQTDAALGPDGPWSGADSDVWNRIARTGRRPIVVNWPGTHPAESLDGVMVSDRYPRPAGGDREHWPLPPQCIHPPDLRRCLGDLRVHPRDVTSRHLVELVPRADQIDQDRDIFLSVVGNLLACGLTAVSAAAWLADHRPWDVLALRLDLIAALEPHVTPGQAPAPRQHSPDGDARWDIRRETLDRAYQWHDHLLGRLSDLAGPEGKVVAVAPGTRGFLFAAGRGVSPGESLTQILHLDEAPAPSITASRAPAPPEAAGAPRRGVSVRPARQADSPAVKLLVPDPPYDPYGPVAFVAAGTDRRILGAVVLACNPTAEDPPGVPVAWGVQPDSRGQGIEDALLARAEREARDWRMRALYAWRLAPRDSDAAADWRRLGFTAHHTVREYEVTDTPLLAAYDPLLDRLRRHGKIPRDARVVPVEQVPLDQVVALYLSCWETRVDPRALLLRLQGQGPRPFSRRLSTALLLGREMIALGLAVEEDPETAFVEAHVIHRRYRHTWAAGMIRAESFRHGVKLGFKRMRFAAGPTHADTYSVVARLHLSPRAVLEQYVKPVGGGT